MSKVVERPSRELLADRWAGTLVDIAEIARVALSAFVESGAPPRFSGIDVNLYEGGPERLVNYSDPDTFLEQASGLDLDSIRQVRIWAMTPRGMAPVDDQSISVNFERGFGGGVFIGVGAPADYETFVIVADEKLSRAVERGELRMPAIERPVKILSLLLVLGAAAIGAFTEGNAWAVIGLAMAAVGALALDLQRLMLRLFPPFELLPEGGITKARRLWNRVRSVAIELGKPAYAALVTAVFVWLLIRVFD